MESLTLEQAYYIGELFTAAVVIVSLIYLALQVKQNTQMMRVAAAQSHAASYISSASNFVQSESFAEAWRQGLDDPTTLTGGQVTQFYAQLGILFTLMESAHNNWEENALDPTIWERQMHQLLDVVSTPGGQQWWSMRNHHYEGSFKKLMEERQRSHKARLLYPPLAS